MNNPIFHSQYTAAQIEASIGKSPRVNAGNIWEVWNIETSAYVSTGVRAGVQPPFVAAEVADMTDTGQTYIYAGDETGYTYGHWYYWNGSTWTDGGAYQAAAADDFFSTSSTNPVQNKVLTPALLAAFPMDTIENVPVASFPDGADNIFVKSLTVNIDPVQSGSGDPSPDNVRPISGWTGANVRDYGAELSFTPLAKSFNYNTGEDNDSTRRISTGYFPCVGFNLIVVSSTSSVGETAWCFKDANDNVIPGNTHAMSTRYFIEVPSNAVYAKVRVGNQYNVCTPSSDRGFAVNLGVTYPVSWQTEAGTVYGGTLDVTTGVLTITMASVDMGTLEWAYATEGDYPYFSVGYSASARFNSASVLLCSAYKYIGAKTASAMRGESADLVIAGRTSNRDFMVHDFAYTDPTAFTTAVSGQTIVYQLDTPQTVQLSPTEVKTLLGANNIFADCGDIAALTYRADTALYIEKKLGAGA